MADRAEQVLHAWQATTGTPGPARTPQALADLRLVDQLESRLEQMDFPDVRGGTLTAADPLRRLFDAARSTILRWHHWEDVAVASPPTLEGKGGPAPTRPGR